MELKKNDIIELNITSMSHDGSGIGRYQGLAVFVPMTAVGDKVNVKILKVQKNMAYGKVMEILEPSKDRIEPKCQVFNRCGGCVYHHITYEAELALKEKRVADTLRRIGGIDIIPNTIMGAVYTERYRNKAEFPVGKNKEGCIISGFYAPRSHNIIDCESCHIQNETADRVKNIVVDFMERHNVSPYNEKSREGIVRHIFVRTGAVSGEVMVVIVINADNLPHADKLTQMLQENIKGLVSLQLNINKENTNVILGNKFVLIYGKDYINDTLCGLQFKISAPAFYQVNHSQCEILYNEAIKMAGLTGSEVCVDLYCGIGTITLILARHSKKVYGVEIVEEAVLNAKENAQINNIKNAEFFCGSADKAAEMLLNNCIRPDVVTVDPPRKGLMPELIDTIVKMSPKRVVYVSCDPATLARDLKIFKEKGYKVENVTPVDMFPRTHHVECVVLMQNVKNK